MLSSNFKCRSRTQPASLLQHFPHVASEFSQAWPSNYLFKVHVKPAVTQQQTLVKVSPKETPFPIAAAFYKVSAHVQVVVGQSTGKECGLRNQKM